MSTTTVTDGGIHVHDVNQDHIKARDKSLGWYSKDRPQLSAAVTELLEEYSHIPSDEIEHHVIALVSVRPLLGNSWTLNNTRHPFGGLLVVSKDWLG